MEPSATSYPRNKINLLFLENISETAVKYFRSQGYSSVEKYTGALNEEELARAVRDVHILGIRSKTHVTKKVLDAAKKLQAQQAKAAASASADQEEEEQVIYGITKNIDHKHDPIHINFHEYYDIIRDVRSADNFKEKLFYIFGDPGDIGTYKKQKEIKQQQQ